MGFSILFYKFYNIDICISGLLFILVAPTWVARPPPMQPESSFSELGSKDGAVQCLSPTENGYELHITTRNFKHRDLNSHLELSACEGPFWDVMMVQELDVRQNLWTVGLGSIQAFVLPNRTIAVLHSIAPHPHRRRGYYLSAGFILNRIPFQLVRTLFVPIDDPAELKGIFIMNGRLMTQMLVLANIHGEWSNRAGYSDQHNIDAVTRALAAIKAEQKDHAGSSFYRNFILAGDFNLDHATMLAQLPTWRTIMPDMRLESAVPLATSLEDGTSPDHILTDLPLSNVTTSTIYLSDHLSLNANAKLPYLIRRAETPMPTLKPIKTTTAATVENPPK